MFTKILIANRGEIACRIIKTARAMGIQTVAIYSSADKNSLHVQLADSAYWVGEAESKNSYLNTNKIIDIAHESGAQAIHPGYGFLSENPLFAQACEEAQIVFIGPTIKAMEAMASKQLAKQLLESSHVPLTPGYHGKTQSEAHLLKEAQKIGFPILIKAANGGGGKGMRAVYLEDEFCDALSAAKRESMASFADDTVILEKLMLNPRHVEVQIMADAFGNVVHLFERDCSIQRRHQKIIEEAPAPNLPSSLREKLAQAACLVARSIDYRSAGTVEFLVDEDEQFYFMEMNTRLQVEHPVTEMITGIDCVAWQLHIAANKPLPLTQDQIHAQGHAIECRIYAEDPFNQFIPSIGQINFLKEPSFEGIRIDTGVRLHSNINKYYDPMIAKLISWGQTREDALHRMQQALAHYLIGGVKTNIPFLQAIYHNPHFVQAKLSTNFLNTQTLPLTTPDKDLALLMTIAFDYLNTRAHTADPLFCDTFSWQMNTQGRWLWRYQGDDGVICAFISPLNAHQFTATIKGDTCHIFASLKGHCLTIEARNQTHKAEVVNLPRSLTLYSEKGPISIERFDWNKQDAKASSHKGQLTAPMPATIVAVLKKIGEPVKAGERLIILEAMKMEHTIHAPADGILTEIFYTVGAQVSEGAELLSLNESEN